MKKTGKIALALLLIVLLAGCGGTPGTGAESGGGSMTTPEMGQETGDVQPVVYTGRVTDRFTEGTGEDTAEVLALETEDGETVYLTLLEGTAIQNGDVVSVGDQIEVESENRTASGYHPALTVTLLSEPMELSSPNAPYGRIRLTLPAAGWEAEAREYDPKADGMGEFGFTFWPEEAPELQVSLTCYPLGFGMCGTGVTIEDITLPGGQRATTYTEGDGDNFSFTLCYQDVPGDYVAAYWGSKVLWEQYKDDTLSILGKAELGAEDILPEEQALELAKGKYNLADEGVASHFDVTEGYWQFSCYKGGMVQWFRVYPDGTVEEQKTEP